MGTLVQTQWMQHDALPLGRGVDRAQQDAPHGLVPTTKSGVPQGVLNERLHVGSSGSAGAFIGVKPPKQVSVCVGSIDRRAEARLFDADSELVLSQDRDPTTTNQLRV